MQLMASLWVTVPLAVLAAALLTFLFLRLQLHRLSGGGRAAYIGGSVLVVLVAVWSAITSISDYNSWFVITAYPILSALQFLVLAVGSGLLTVALALYADKQRTFRQELETREQRLDLLQRLQMETRAPYQLLELLTLTLRELLVTNPERAGITFLINRGKRQLVLGATANLTKNEIANLEHISLDHPLVSQAVDLGEPMIAGPFEMTDAKGIPVQSRFQSSLILPLVSGTERIGALVLLAEESRAFGRTDLMYVAPVADWAAEKIRTARLNRELSLVRTELEQSTRRQLTLIDRLSASAQALGGSVSLPDFCRQLIGVAGATEAYVCGLSAGTVQIYGGTEPLADLTEQFRLTLVDALERRKPLIINHESGETGGRVSIIRSSLVFPTAADSTDALLLRKEGGAFSVSDHDLHLLTFFGLLARFALQQRETSRRDLSRRVGFEKVIQLIQPSDSGAAPRVGYFMHHLADILPAHSQVITLARQSSGLFAAADAIHVPIAELMDLQIETSEGIFADAVSLGAPQFAFGKRAVLAALETASPGTQQALHTVWGERRIPQMLAVCPLTHADKIDELALLMLYDLAEQERVEWERLLTLAVGLFGLRSRLLAGAEQVQRIELTQDSAMQLAPLVNELNNHLSAVIGTADLAAGREDVSGDLRSLLKSIVSEADQAARTVKRTFQTAIGTNNPAETSATDSSVNQLLESVLSEIHISGNLYMAGGRPRELDVRLGDGADIHFDDNDIRKLFEGVLNRFAAIASDEDVLSIATYLQGDYLFLDISRHRKNFPPVEPVAGFGDYLPADQAYQHRPSDVFLKPVTQGPCFYASDTSGATPAYLSFKFPLKATAKNVRATRPAKQLSILAIDDQAVILDLISAMCQSLGYYVQTASNGSEGLKFASSGKFDIILTDLAMPDMTGLEVARRIRALHPHTPIILVTGWEAGLDQSEIEKAGISELLLKPFRIEQLTEIIRSLAAKVS